MGYYDRDIGEMRARCARKMGKMRSVWAELRKRTGRATMQTKGTTLLSRPVRKYPYGAVAFARYIWRSYGSGELAFRQERNAIVFDCVKTPEFSVRHWHRDRRTFAKRR
eukprot:3729115-Pleurochrysis_carterae.AAC.3